MEKSFYNLTDSDYPSTNQMSTCKKSWGNTIVHKFLQGILFHTQRKDGANTTVYDLPKEIVTAIMMLYKNTKAMVRLQDGDIVARVLQRDTPAQ